MKFLKVFLYLVIAVVVIVAALYIRGMYLPMEHTVERSITVAGTRSAVWQAITDVPAQTAWRSDLKAVEIAPSEGGDPCFREVMNGMKVPYCQHIDTPERRVTHRIPETNPMFHGLWTYQLESVTPTSTRVTITENGVVPNPLARFFTYQMGVETTVHNYEMALAKHFDR